MILKDYDSHWWGLEVFLFRTLLTAYTLRGKKINMWSDWCVN